jgi:uncharacterized protein DUF1996
MKRLLLASAALILPSPAFAAPYSLTGSSAPAGQPVNFTFTRSDVEDSAQFKFETIDDSAKAGTDYTAQSQIFTLGAGQASTVLAVPTQSNDASAGLTLNLSAKVTLLTPQVVSAGASIVEPPPVVTLAGLAPIPSVFDYKTALTYNGVIPKSGAPDIVGAFRFICGAGQVLADDPIVYPGQPGKSHLHQFYGNTGINAGSTYTNTRVGNAPSTCENGASNPLNKSGYWMPAMLDGVGHVVEPDYVSIYYKRLPISDPRCALPGTMVTLASGTKTPAQGICEPIPNGLKMIAGFDMISGTAPTGSFHFNCQGPNNAKPGTYKTFADAVAACPYVPGAAKQNQIGAIINMPDCWDGKRIDSANHRDHVSYGNRNNWYGALECPADHPYLMPQFTLSAWYTVDANLAKWALSSDAMISGAAPGSTFHADYFEAWDPNAKAEWTAGCINQMLNCSAGELGDGYHLKGADKPAYGWTNPNRLVPVPAGGM